MHRPSLAILALTLCFVPALAMAQDFDAAGEQAMLEQINALRAQNQLPALTRAPALDAIARSHSVDMASQGTLGHVSSTTGTPDDRLRRAAIATNAHAENVAMHRDTARASEALVASPGHRENMLSPHVSHVGLGSTRTSSGVYVTQLFAALPAERAPVVAEAAPAPTDEVPTIAAPVVDAPVDAVIAPAEVDAPVPAGAAPTLPGALDPTALFGLIPPFVEQVLGGDLPSPMPGAAMPAPSAASAPGVASASPSVPGATGPGATVPSATVPSATVPADALRRLVDMAQSLLGSATPAQ